MTGTAEKKLLNELKRTVTVDNISAVWKETRSGMYKMNIDIFTLVLSVSRLYALV